MKLENPNRKTEIEGIQEIFEDIVTEKKIMKEIESTKPRNSAK